MFTVINTTKHITNSMTQTVKTKDFYSIENAKQYAIISVKYSRISDFVAIVTADNRIVWTYDYQDK